MGLPALLLGGLGALLATLALSARAAPLLVIVSPQRAAVTMDRAELALVFQRKRLYWTGGGRIQPVNLPARHPARLQFSQAVLGASPGALDSYWNEQYFHGVRPPYVVPSAAAMLRFIADTPSAIGYVDACDAPVEVALAVIGVIEADGRLRATRRVPPCVQPPRPAPTAAGPGTTGSRLR